MKKYISFTDAIKITIPLTAWTILMMYLLTSCATSQQAMIPSKNQSGFKSKATEIQFKLWRKKSQRSRRGQHGT